MWKTVPNFDNYEASEDGRIRNKLTNTELKLTLGTDKYLKVHLRKDKQRYTKRVNRVIAETFLPNDQNFPQVNHINGVKTDNPDLDNLPYYRWSEEAILSSRDGCTAITRYYDVNGTKIKTLQGVLEFTGVPEDLWSTNITNKIQIYFDTHGYTVKRLNKPIS